MRVISTMSVSNLRTAAFLTHSSHSPSTRIALPNGDAIQASEVVCPAASDRRRADRTFAQAWMNRSTHSAFRNTECPHVSSSQITTIVRFRYAMVNRGREEARCLMSEIYFEER